LKHQRSPPKMPPHSPPKGPQKQEMQQQQSNGGNVTTLYPPQGPCAPTQWAQYPYMPYLSDPGPRDSAHGVHILG
jgi:hypothetical protein